MARPTTSSLPIIAALLLAATWGCTTNKQEAPPLTGPSELGTSIVITVSPDVLRQDGASQSLVTVTARDNQGQPLRNVSLRAEITVGGVITDFGSLSARNVVTDTSGRATMTYTAPPAGPVSVDNGTTVGITVSPMGTDFGNFTSKTVDIRLVPPGVIGAPPSSLRVAMTLPSAVVGDTAVFTANVTDSTGADASAQVAAYQWNFGDGTSGSGRAVTHTYGQPGNFVVTLTITDTLARVAQTSQSLTVSLPATSLNAAFLYSPNPSQLHQPVHFDASTSTVTPPHRIVSYTWNFGEGTVRTSGSPRIDFTYTLPRTYVVILTVTDDTGQFKTTSQTITPQ
jgi:PKD repeat protein